MIHRHTHTYFIELTKDEYFGEVEFFTEQPRMISARSRDFTECYTIDNRDFLRIA
jgi:hypothetical protein